MIDSTSRIIQPDEKIKYFPFEYKYFCFSMYDQLNIFKSISENFGKIYSQREFLPEFKKYSTFDSDNARVMWGGLQNIESNYMFCFKNESDLVLTKLIII